MEITGVGRASLMEEATRSTGSTKAWLALVATVSWNWDMLAGGEEEWEEVEDGGGAHSGFCSRNSSAGVTFSRSASESPGRKHPRQSETYVDTTSPPPMSSYGAFLPSVARAILSPYRVPCLREKAIAPFALNAHQVRGAKSKSKPPQRKKGSAHFAQNDLKDALQFTLCDAMRYI